VSRYLLGVGLQRISADFPYSTMLINVSGSFLIGLFARLFDVPGESS